MFRSIVRDICGLERLFRFGMFKKDFCCMNFKMMRIQDYLLGGFDGL
jgi:hypothetical protein